MIAKDFQRITANRIVDLFRAGGKRVLLADEVGLGKTVVAKAVVQKTQQWFQEQSDQPYVVIYLCSNASIAEQNCSKLGIDIENRFSISEGRLSMQHLTLEETHNQRDVKLIPMTSGTSLKTNNSAGLVSERALIYVILTQTGVMLDIKKELYLLLRTSFVTSKESWQREVTAQQSRIKALPDKKAYLSAMKEYLTVPQKDATSTSTRGYMTQELWDDLHEMCAKIRKRGLGRYNVAGLKKLIPWSERQAIINRMRYCFAQISLGRLNPALVIMDEFQRFKDLIEVADDDPSDEAILSRRFLHDNTTSCVLLLSATPYKPYATLSELTAGEESHLQGFMKVMDYLIYDQEANKNFHQVWSSYSEHLTEITSKNLNVLLAKKNDAQDVLYQYMCRTERRYGGIISTDKVKTMSNISLGDIQSYTELQKLMNRLQLGSFPIEYVKSAPFLMSFMNYKVKDKLDAVLAGEKPYPLATGEMGYMTPENRNKYIKQLSHSFLKRSLINQYQPLPNNNARLHTLFQEVFSGAEGKKGQPELLLWIPPANKYYKVGKKSVFEKCEGYTKTLVFSSWEMVPRVIATLTSYEAERLVNKEITHKDAEAQSYYAVPEEEDFWADGSTSAQKKSKTRFLIREQRELVAYPSYWLAEKYDGSRYYGWKLGQIQKEIRQQLQKEIGKLAREQQIPRSHLGAKQLVLFLKAMDTRIINESRTYPDRCPLDKDLDVLVNMAIGSPAVCLLRALAEVDDIEQRQNLAQDCCDTSFVSMFNRPEARGIMRVIYGDKAQSKAEHYEQVFHYCVDGNFQSMLDEFKFVLALTGQDLTTAIKNSFLQTTNLPYVSQEFYRASFSEHPRKQQPRLRVHFAAGYFDTSTNDKTVQRAVNIRKAFNSPFRPFVLATTSIGQEGLDFHLYSRKIVHWNLPSNPVDLEQREGRINRYMCHAIRQNVAANEPDGDWQAKFDQTRQKYGQGSSELIPYWCLPEEYPYQYHIERVVPMYPYSRDQLRYQRLIEVLALYRLTLGQPQQDEIMAMLQKEKLNKEQKEKLFFDLSPYSHHSKKN